MSVIVSTAQQKVKGGQATGWKRPVCLFLFVTVCLLSSVSSLKCAESRHNEKMSILKAMSELFDLFLCKNEQVVHPSLIIQLKNTKIAHLNSSAIQVVFVVLLCSVRAQRVDKSLVSVMVMVRQAVSRTLLVLEVQSEQNIKFLRWKISVIAHLAVLPGCCRRSSCSSRRSRLSSPSSPSRGSRTPRGTACPS